MAVPCRRTSAPSCGTVPVQGPIRTVLDSAQTVPELLTRFGADGWDLVGLQEHREGDGQHLLLRCCLLSYHIHLQTPSPFSGVNRLTRGWPLMIFASRDAKLNRRSAVRRSP